MNWQYTLYIISVFSAVTVTFLVTWYTWRYRHVQGAMAFLVIILLGSWLSFAEALSVISYMPALAHFWYRTRFISIAGLSVAWLGFAFQYSGRRQWLTIRRIAGVLVIPLITQVIIWTNHLHGLWEQQPVSFFQLGPFLLADTSTRISGGWFWIHSGYSYVLALIAMIVIFHISIRSFRIYRMQVISLWFGALVIVIGSAFPTFHMILGVKINPLVLSVTIGGVLVAWAIFRYQLLNVIPIARDTLIDLIDDGILVMDIRNRIIDLNPAMVNLLSGTSDCDIAPAHVIGQPIANVLSFWRTLTKQHVGDRHHIQTEITLEYQEIPHYFDVRIVALTSQRGHLTSRLIVLHDITERKQAEQELREVSRNIGT